MEQIDVGYKRAYRFRKPIRGRKYIATAMPYEVVEREAAKRQMTVEEFCEAYEAIVEFDNFEGLRYTFKEREQKSIVKES